MLKVKNLVKEFYQRTEEITVVNNLSLEVKRGQVFGLIGPNGAGKTTTVKMIGGLLYPTKGKITIKNFTAGSLESKKIIGFMSENPQFYNHLKAREVLEFVSELFGFEKKKMSHTINCLLENFRLFAHKEVMIRKFSKGINQRLAFAVAMINDPELLILDEPLDGLDPLGRLDFKRIILENKSKGRTIFFSSHILSDVEEICDEVAIINNGKILLQGQPKALIGKNKETLEELFVRTIRNA